jgi:hypothetical protein
MVTKSFLPKKIPEFTLTKQTVVVLDAQADTLTYKLCDLGIAKIWDPTANQTRRGRGTGSWMPKVTKLSSVFWALIEHVRSGS